MAIYAITGITGQVGGAAAKQLIEVGASVRAVVRKESSAAAWRALGAEVVVAELADPVALARAFDKADGVFVMTPTWFESADMFAENERVLHALSQAFSKVDDTKIVILSSIGADQLEGTGAIGKLHAMEKAFSNLPHVTALRAAWFMENYVGMIDDARTRGVLPSMLYPLDRPIPMVATHDIGFMVAARLQETWTGQHVIEFAGPHDYSPNDVAIALGKALKREVRAEKVDEGDWLAAFASWGLTPRSAMAMSEMIQGFNNRHIKFTGDRTESVPGATTLESFISEGVNH